MKHLFKIAPMSAMLLASGMVACGGQASFGLPDSSVDYSQAVQINNKVDMVIVMDNSSGMSGHAVDIANSAPSFVNALMAQGLDLHVAVVTTSMGGTNPNGGRFMNNTYLSSSSSSLATNLVGQITTMAFNGSDLTRGLDSVAQALSPTYLSGPGAGFLRSDALLAIVAFTDQDDHSVNLSNEAGYVSFLDTLKGKYDDGARRWTMNFVGVMSLTSTCISTGGPGGTYREPGVRWMDLAALSGGVDNTICTTNLAQAVSNIHARIIQILTDYYLGTSTPNLSTVVAKINGNVIPQDATNGWSYIAATNSIRFNGTSTPTAYDKISVTFTPAGAN